MNCLQIIEDWFIESFKEGVWKLVQPYLLLDLEFLYLVIITYIWKSHTFLKSVFCYSFSLFLIQEVGMNSAL